MSYSPNIHRCEHIKINGTQCGSPSLRKKKLCFFHDRWQQQRLAVADSADAIPAGISIAPALNLPILEDANSIQLAIVQVLQLLLTGQLEHKAAALALYGLKAASVNLRRTHVEPYRRDVVIDPSTVNQSLLGEDIWKDSDFDVQPEEKKAVTTTCQGRKVRRKKNNSLAAVNPKEKKPVALVPAPSAKVTANSEATPPGEVSVRVGGNSLNLVKDVASPPDWRAELRAQIEAQVKDAALEGTWLNDMIQASKSGR